MTANYDRAAAAREMLANAIGLFSRKNYATSILLAGAVENMLPVVDPENDVFCGYKKLLEAQDREVKRSVDWLNEPYNKLKHKNSQTFDWSRINEVTAALMVARAAVRFRANYPKEASEPIDLWIKEMNELSNGEMKVTDLNGLSEKLCLKIGMSTDTGFQRSQ